MASLQRYSKEQTQWAVLNQLDGSKELNRRCHDAKAEQRTAIQWSCCEAKDSGKVFGSVMMKIDGHTRHSVSLVTQRLVFGTQLLVVQPVSFVAQRRPNLVLGG